MAIPLRSNAHGSLVVVPLKMAIAVMQGLTQWG